MLLCKERCEKQSPGLQDFSVGNLGSYFAALLFLEKFNIPGFRNMFPVNRGDHLLFQFRQFFCFCRLYVNSRDLL